MMLHSIKFKWTANKFVGTSNLGEEDVGDLLQRTIRSENKDAVSGSCLREEEEKFKFCIFTFFSFGCSWFW